MSLYQGRAMVAERPRRRHRIGVVRRVAQVVLAVALAVAVTRLPWQRLTDRFWVLSHSKVEGHHYLDPDQVLAIAGIEHGQKLDSLDCRAARQALLLHPRIERARVSRDLLRGVTIHISERVPVLVVRHGEPWEMDSTGTLLAPLTAGAVADAPLLSGASFEDLEDGTRVVSPRVKRGLAWSKALSNNELQLTGQVSEIDVSENRTTVLLMLDGTRVLGPSWPPAIRDLSALRVVLADLDRRGTVAREIDIRFQGQVIVRPADLPQAHSSIGTSTG